MARGQEYTCGSKHSSTCDTLSRENSLSSLPETECDWPQLDAPIGQASTPGQSLPGIFMQPLMPTEFGVGPPGQFLPQAPQTSSFQVAYQGGIEVRGGPFDAAKTGQVLQPNEIFSVTQELVGTDGLVYLCLADGRGWVFDDTNLMPNDPSVVRCPCPAPRPPSPPAMPPSLCPALLPPQLQQPSAEMYLPPQHAIPPPPPVPPMLHGELLASTPVGTAPIMVERPDTMHLVMPASSMVASAPPPVSWFRVAYLGGIQLRSAPSIDAPLTGATLPHNETFSVTEEIRSMDGRIYLRLGDGRGWAFDDTNLMPHDPSVKRGSWMSAYPSGSQMLFPSRVLEGTYPDRQHRRYPKPRGKRGGKRCSKRKQSASAAASGVEGQ